jgi:hypothetical protein
MIALSGPKGEYVARNATSKQVDDSRQPVHRRMPRDERMAAMLDQAAPVLADAGFSVSTRTLAAALGVTQALFEPVVRALRKEAGLPSLEERPMLRGERELVMMLHGSVVFLGIREHVYRMPMPDDRDAVIRLQVDIFLAGAVPALRRIHSGEAGASLTVEQLAPESKSGR